MLFLVWVHWESAYTFWNKYGVWVPLFQALDNVLRVWTVLFWYSYVLIAVERVVSMDWSYAFRRHCSIAHWFHCHYVKDTGSSSLWVITTADWEMRSFASKRSKVSAHLRIGWEEALPLSPLPPSLSLSPSLPPSSPPSLFSSLASLLLHYLTPSLPPSIVPSLSLSLSPSLSLSLPLSLSLSPTLSSSNWWSSVCNTFIS